MNPAVRQMVMGGGRGKYLGQVGIRSYLPNQKFATNTVYRSRISTKNPGEAVTALRLVYPNFFVEDFTSGTLYREQGNGGIATVTAAIEYPSGTFTQVLWSGSASHTIASGATGAVSDPCVVSIPANTQYWVRTWYSNASGVIFVNATPLMNSPALLGDQVEAGIGLADNTMGGVYTTSGNTLYGPCAILALTRKASVAYIGDSRMLGENDTLDVTMATGYARKLSQLMGVLDMGVRGDSAVRWLISHTNRLALAQYASHIYCGYGFNDMGPVNSRTAATTLIDLKTIWGTLKGQYPKALLYQDTIAHGSTTSTDAYVTTVNQTPATWNAERVSLNNSIRSTPAPVNGYIELADVLESARDSGIWKVTGVANVYNGGDQTHPNQTGYQLVRDSGYLDALMFTR